MQTERNYSAEDIAARYGVKRSTVNQWLQNGKIECKREKIGLSCRRHVTLQNLLDFEKKYNIEPVK